MSLKPHGAPTFRAPTYSDFRVSLKLGTRDFLQYPLLGLAFAFAFAVAGALMAWVTYVTGQTFWLVLAVLGFPMVGSLAAVGFFEVSRGHCEREEVRLGAILSRVWGQRTGQLPWLAAIVVVIFLFWFFLGHMIFALFLGLSPMTNVSSSLDIYLTQQGMSMIAVGTAIGAVFSVLVFSLSMFGMPMIIDRDIDFMTAMLTSIQQVMSWPVRYLSWGAVVAIITLVSILPGFLGLFVSMPVLGHASWHLYKRVTTPVTRINPSGN